MWGRSCLGQERSGRCRLGQAEGRSGDGLHRGAGDRSLERDPAGIYRCFGVIANAAWACDLQELQRTWSAGKQTGNDEAAYLENGVDRSQLEAESLLGRFCNAVSLCSCAAWLLLYSRVRVHDRSAAIAAMDVVLDNV